MSREVYLQRSERLPSRPLDGAIRSPTAGPRMLVQSQLSMLQAVLHLSPKRKSRAG